MAPFEQPQQVTPEETPHEESQSGDVAFAAQVVQAFGDHIEPPRTPPFYHLSLMLVALFMVLLPVVYLGLVTAAVWGVWWYATHTTGLLTPIRGGARLYLFNLAAYVGPLLAGAVTVLFMFKPLLARRVERIQPLTINPGAEPALYAFICKICQLVRAPVPDEIALASDTNASASFRKGIFSKELRLTIGLPVVASLNMREFAGVMAHEFGHFTQGMAMRLTYIIRTINRWFARVVYERDAWDVVLEQLAEESEHLLLSLVVGLARIGVWFSRFLLMLLMRLGHLVSCYALRRMEYGADEFEIRVAGSEAFESTLLRISLVAGAEDAARGFMQTSWEKHGKLPDDMVRFISKIDASLDPAKRAEIEGRLGMEKTGMFDTHPSHADRIREARRIAAPGIFHLDWPTTSLFQNFEVISRQVTLTHYRDEIGLTVDDENLVPVDRPAAPVTETSVEPPPEPEPVAEVSGGRPKMRLKVRPAASSNPPAVTPVETPKPASSSPSEAGGQAEI
jgi:Zn-dependent protease with chaperone function